MVFEFAEIGKHACSGQNCLFGQFYEFGLVSSDNAVSFRESCVTSDSHEVFPGDGDYSSGMENIRIELVTSWVFDF